MIYYENKDETNNNNLPKLKKCLLKSRNKLSLRYLPTITMELKMRLKLEFLQYDEKMSNEIL